MTEQELLRLIHQAKDEGWTELDLSGQYLTSLPPELGELHELRVLKLGHNPTKDRKNYLVRLPDEMAYLTNLQLLDLSGNNLKVLPDELARLINLQSLNLRENKLTVLPNWLGRLTNLQSLNLNSNNLTSFPDRIFELTNLESLLLGFNNLTVLSTKIGQLTRLLSLHLGFNNFKMLPSELAQLTKLRTLDLSGNELASLPAWIAQLVNLQHLNLRSTSLTNVPNKIAQLTRLQSLNLRGNYLTSLPEEIAHLSNLRVLDLSGNDLTILPSSLAQLTNLQSLDLSNNTLTSIPAWLPQLINLQALSLSDNDLALLPDWLAQMVNLRSLGLSNVNLTVLPDWLLKLSNLQSLYLRGNKLTELPKWLAQPDNLPHLHELYLWRNPLFMPPLEVLGTALTDEFIRADVDTIRRYFRQLQEQSSVYLYEAKLLIIGEGGAGKTSLARKLLEPDCQLLPDESSTEGIAIRRWHFSLTDAQADNYTVNVWDFGGQEIYFATHQFFLTRRSVYLLVADTRHQHTDFYTWLRMQETFGADSPVLLVKNRNRQHGNSFTIGNLPQLRERFPNLQEVIELDLNEVPQERSWADLLHHVQEYLLRLPHIGQPRPAAWIAVRKAIAADERDVIGWPAFLELCRAQGMKRDDDIHQLAEYLHNLGDILFFHEDPILRDYVILKPTWGLDAVYKVLDNRTIERQLGHFSLGDLRTLWHEPIYQGYHLHLLRLMENFQLCYPLVDVKDSYIAPQLLSEEAPAYTWEASDNLQLRYVYPVFMPRGILSRAIVKLHQRIAEQQLVWRSGVILHDDFARAEVLELRGDQQIRIRVSGRNKRDLLMEIVRALDELHLGFPKLQVERRIPCNCPACRQRPDPHFYALEKLREMLADRQETIQCQNRPYQQVPILGMLSELGDWQPTGAGRGGIHHYYGPVYQGDHQGDDYQIGNITDATGVVIGQAATAIVTHG